MASTIRSCTPDNLGAGGNYARYANADVDANIATARATIDDAERARLYQEVDAQFAEDLPYIPLTHNIYVDVSTPRVQNYVPSPMDTHMFHRVWVEE